MRTALVWIQGGKIVDGYLSRAERSDPDFPARDPSGEQVKPMPVLDFLRSGRWQFRSVSPAAETGKGDQFRIAVVLDEP